MPGVLSLVIGVLAVMPQRIVAQHATLLLPPGSEEFRDRFKELLMKPSGTRLAQGWQLAAELGPVVAPVLWDLHDSQRSDLRLRLQLLPGAVLAGGIGGDERLLRQVVADSKVDLDERVMALLLLATGPAREAPLDVFSAMGRNRSTFAVIAEYLAAARTPKGGSGAPSPADADVGVLAAAIAAGAPATDAALEKYFKPEPAPKFASLVWRGYFLGRLRDGGVDPDPAGDALLLQRARDVLLLPAAPAEAKACAALLLSRSGKDTGLKARPSWELLQCLLSCSNAAALHKDWVGPQPGPRDDEPARLAVEYVLGRPPAEVLREGDVLRWTSAPRVAQHVAVALALRLLDGSQPPPPLPPAPAGLPEWFWIAWATGQTELPTMTSSDAALAQAALLAATGRLPRPAARILLEDTLWRWGSHPGLCLREAQLLLVRDLLLTGTSPGMKYGGQRERYQPKGMQIDNDLARVGVEFFDFVFSRPRLPVSRECRLR